MKHHPNICAAEATARERAKASTAALLLSLQQHHPEFATQRPDDVLVESDYVAEWVKRIIDPIEMALKQMQPEPESVGDWAKRQHDNNPIEVKPDDPDAVPIGIPIRNIQQACAQHYGITLLELISARRAKEIVHPRQVAMYIAKKLTTRSFPEIGRRFGGRDHTTVLHAVRKIERLMRTDPKLVADIDAIRASLS